MSYWDHVHHHTDLARFWMSHPLVRAQINKEITGSPHVWPVEWFADQFRERLPLREVVSIGSGVGNLERVLVQHGIANHVVGIEEAGEPLHIARVNAANAGLDGSIQYVQADARQYLAAARNLDGIFFHASLHHFDRLDELMNFCRTALKPDGLLYLDEYIGPGRDEWTWVRMVLPNLVYYLLPRKARRVGVIRAPINREDPTEAIDSSRILPAVERSFRVIDRRDYGGNFVSLLYPNLRIPDLDPNPPPPAIFAKAVGRLLWLEHWLRQLKVTSFHAVIVAEPQAV